jgi:hypothetical protein
VSRTLPLLTSTPLICTDKVTERITRPAAASGVQPHIVLVLLDDFGWAEAGWHRNTTLGNVTIPYTNEVQTPGTLLGFEQDFALEDGIHAVICVRWKPACM